MPRFPKRVRAGTEHTLVFERRNGLYSVRGRRRGADEDAVAVLHDDASTSFAVYEGAPLRRRAEDEEIGPVYSAGPDGPLAVPTGRVFVRLEEGLGPDARSAEFARAGFEIEQRLSYAPNAAWLRPAHGGVAKALPALAALERIPGVVHVEPQLLLARAWKVG